MTAAATKIHLSTAMTTGKSSHRLGIFAALSIAVAVILADQTSKNFAKFRSSGHIWLIDNFFALSYCENTGAAFGILAGHRNFLCTIALAVLAAALFFYRRLLLWEPLNAICFGLIYGGIVGNLMDRLRCGFVVDFIALRLPLFGWNTFNVADSALCSGVAIYILSEFLR